MNTSTGLLCIVDDLVKDRKKFHSNGRLLRLFHPESLFYPGNLFHPESLFSYPLSTDAKRVQQASLQKAADNKELY